MFFRRIGLAALAAALSVPAAELTLNEVLDSVRRSFPPLLAAFQDRPLAEADVLSSLGRFDIILRSRGEADDLGPLYRDRAFDTSIEQATPAWGLNYFTGYRYADGTFAPYDGRSATGRFGEYRAGIRLPLLRDRAIDFRRAELQKARIGLRVADLSIDQQRIVITQAATRRYWDWVAAGQRLKVAKDALDIAEKRESFLNEALAQGAIPAIDVTDNARVILQRRGFLVEAQRLLEQATIELSLFIRDNQAEPDLVPPSRLPTAFPPPQPIDDSRLRNDIELALDRRPEVKRFLAQRDQISVDQRLAINQQYPGVDAIVSYTRQLGSDALGRGPNEIRGTLAFELPLQRRTARGREDAADARLSQIDQRTRYQRDQIVAEVQDAVSAVRNAFLRTGVLNEEVKATVRVEGAERERYELGDTNLFTLNLRELATVDAELREVAALAEYYRAFALYDLAIAEALSPRQP